MKNNKMKTKVLLIVAMILLVNSYRTYQIIHKLKLEKHKFISKKKPEHIKITITMYYATPGQCDDSPLVTACGYKINPYKASEHKWIAVSRDLLKKFKYGEKVRISNAGKKNGIYTVADCMAKRFNNKVDILENENTPLYKLTNAIIEKV